MSFVDDEGIWVEVKHNKTDFSQYRGRPALFLDRDGTIIEHVPYLHRPEQVVLLPGAAETIELANKLAIPVIQVTNQSGVGRGYYNWDDFSNVQNNIYKKLRQTDAWIDVILACPFHSEASGIFKQLDHPYRKPNPGMLFRAKELLSLDLKNSWIVGDSAIDILAGKSAGCRGGAHVLTGNTSEETEIEKIKISDQKRYKDISINSIKDLATCIPLFE